MTTVHRIHALAPTQGGFHLDICKDPAEVTIYVRGELDIATTPVLSNCLSDILDTDTDTASRCRAVVIDLSAAPFVDVGAANLLLDAHQRATDRGATLFLTGCSAQVIRLLHLINAQDVIDMIPPRRARTTAQGDTAASSAHTDFPSGNGVTPHRDDTAATTCNPRPRRLLRSTGCGCGGGHG